MQIFTASTQWWQILIKSKWSWRQMTWEITGQTIVSNSWNQESKPQFWSIKQIKQMANEIRHIIKTPWIIKLLCNYSIGLPLSQKSWSIAIHKATVTKTLWSGLFCSQPWKIDSSNQTIQQLCSWHVQAFQHRTEVTRQGQEHGQIINLNYLKF